MLNDLLNQHSLKIIRIAALVAGVVVMLAVSKIIGTVTTKRVSPQAGMLAQKFSFYSSLAIIFTMILNEFGFKLNSLLGAAGVAGVAIGFASQTSLSNLISGLFLIGEKAFKVNDVIKCGDTLGIVLSIDLLSVKIKTFDNQFVRIPNETLIKSTLINITRFPIRRMDIDVGVSYKDDLNKVISVLKEVAAKNEIALREPEPLVVIKGFADSSIDLLLGVWFSKTDFLALKNSIIPQIKAAFDENGIEIPFPQRSLHIHDPSSLKTTTQSLG